MSAFRSRWLRYACPCGYTRDTLDAGDREAPCASCSRMVRAAELPDPDPLADLAEQAEAFRAAMLAGLQADRED